MIYSHKGVKRVQASINDIHRTKLFDMEVKNNLEKKIKTAKIFKS